VRGLADGDAVGIGGHDPDAAGVRVDEELVDRLGDRVLLCLLAVEQRVDGDHGADDGGHARDRAAGERRDLGFLAHGGLLLFGGVQSR
jgi:hypothetical protein